MKTIMRPLVGALVLIALFVLLFGVFVVREGQSAIILRLGKIRGTGSSAVLGPGLHFKIPLVDSLRVFDRRLQQLANSTSGALTVVTSEQTYLVVEYFARWRISDPVKFYTSTGGSIAWADSLLEQRMNDVVRAGYGRRTSDEAVSTDRPDMTRMMREQADVIGQDLGIHVSDVRIRQITLPGDVIQSVFERMSSERKQFAAAKRAEGRQKSEEIRADADQQATVIRAKAVAEGAALRAKGDEEAARMYAAAYSSNSEFYAFYRSLEAYRKSFSGGRDVLVLQPNGQFFKYFHGSAQALVNLSHPTSRGRT